MPSFIRQNITLAFASPESLNMTGDGAGLKSYEGDVYAFGGLIFQVIVLQCDK